MRRKTVKWVVAILCAVALAGASLLWYAGPTAEPEAARLDEVVARVNDTAITAGQLQTRVEQRKMAYAMQQEQLSDEQLRRKVLDDIIAEILLYDEALRRGIEVDDDALQEQFDTLAAQFEDEEELGEYFAQQGVTQQDLKRQIRMQMKMQAVIDEHVEQELDSDQLQVSEEEIRQLYEEHAAETEDYPEFEEAKPYLREEILHQRQQVVIQSLIERLRAEADIQFGPE